MDQGVAIDPQMEYCLVEHGEGLLIVAKERVDDLRKSLDSSLELVATFKGESQ